MLYHEQLNVVHANIKHNHTGLGDDQRDWGRGEREGEGGEGNVGDNITHSNPMSWNHNNSTPSSTEICQNKFMILMMKQMFLNSTTPEKDIFEEPHFLLPKFSTTP